VAQFLSHLTHWPPALVYLVAALVVGSETGTILGLVVPGEITLLIVGFLCYEGTLHLAIALPVMLIGALAGDSLGYLAGRRLGHRLRDTRLGRRVGERRWAKADGLLLRHGGRAVFLGRFVAFARTLVPRLAGISGLPYREFLPWSAAGVACVAGGTLLVGYAAGRSYETVTAVFGQASSAVLAFVLLVIAIVLVGRYLGRYPDPLFAAGQRLAALPPLRFVERAYRSGFAWLTGRVGVGGAVAVNVLGGAVALLGVGYALTWTVDGLVRHSGLLLVDPLLTRWAAHHRSPVAVRAATDTLLTLRGSFLVLLVGLVAIALNWRSRVWRADLAGVLGTVGAFVPLVIITLVTDWERAPDATPTPGFFPNQTAVVVASLGMLAWLLSRRYGWRLAVPAWTAAIGAAVVVGAGRVYVGWSWPSEVVASTLLGALWVLVFMVAWHTRDKVRADEPDRSGSAPMVLTR
jgi:membrane protein DedA with SNARE-associated domain/membrane-associated phospholipid phosphatase